MGATQRDCGVVLGRWGTLLTAGLLLAATSSMAGAQEIVGARGIEEYELPTWARSMVHGIYEDSSTRRFEGATYVEAGDEVRGGLLITEGSLAVDGVVEGDVVVINGDLEFGPEGWIEGDVTVLGGSIVDDVSRAGGTMTVYRTRIRRRDRRGATERRQEPIGHVEESAPAAAEEEWLEGDARDEEHAGPGERRDRRRRSDREWEDRWRFGRGEAGITGRVGPTYNRTEGLPIGVGPRIRIGGPAPLEVEALAILRTATSFDSDIDEFDDDEVGYSIRLEQRVGYEAQGIFGGRIYSVAESIEHWGLSDTETSLATLLWREDYRDYFDREGWSAYAGVRVPEAGLRLTLDYRDEEYGFRPVADPWTPFDRDEPWRPQPLAAEGSMTSLGAELVIDLPDYYGPFGGGWSLRAMARRGLEGAPTRPAHTTSSGIDLPEAVFEAEDVRYGFADLRRYNYLGWNNRLDLRLIAGGALNDAPLPPQFQQAFGGFGSVPGHELFIGDCGARDVSSSVSRIAGGVARQDTFSNYGCDRFMLFQAEYRGGLDFDWGWDDGANRGRDPENWGNWEDWDRGRERFDTDFEWSLFFDAGRGWALGVDDPSLPRYDTETLMDAGFGFWLGGVGVLAAVPLDTDDHPLRWFLRLEHRF